MVNIFEFRLRHLSLQKGHEGLLYYYLEASFYSFVLFVFDAFYLKIYEMLYVTIISNECLHWI